MVSEREMEYAERNRKFFPAWALEGWTLGRFIRQTLHILSKFFRLHTPTHKITSDYHDRFHPKPEPPNSNDLFFTLLQTNSRFFIKIQLFSSFPASVTTISGERNSILAIELILIFRSFKGPSIDGVDPESGFWRFHVVENVYDLISNRKCSFCLKSALHSGIQFSILAEGFSLNGSHWEISERSLRVLIEPPARALAVLV